MKKTPKSPPVTLADVWATLDEVAQINKESGRKLDKMIAESEKHERRMKKIEKTMGSWSYSHGCFAQDYFFNAFADDEQDFFGEHFHKISNQLKIETRKLAAEYDIVMYNDNYVAIIEVKYKAHKNDIPKVIDQARTFRILCPDYKDFKIYLALASMALYPELEQECIDQGIAVIKQVGDTVVIRDENMKVF